MKKYLKLFVVLATTLSLNKAFTKDTLVYRIAERAPVYYTDNIQAEKLIFYAEKNEKVKVLSRSGQYQVLFADGRIGWLDKLSFAETRKMVATDSINVYSKPDFQSKYQARIGTGDTVLYMDADEKHVFYQVRYRKTTGWIPRQYFHPLGEQEIGKYNRDLAIYSYANLSKKTGKITPGNLERKFGPPESVNRQNGLQVVYYGGITAVKDAKHYPGVFFFLDQNGFVKDSLVGDGYAKWFEKLPLAAFMRDISLGRALNIANWPVFQRLDRADDNNRTLKILFLILKFAILALFFIVPVFASKYFYTWVRRVRFLPNLMVKIMNFVFFLLIFYLYYLFMLQQIFHVMATTFTIGMAVAFFYAIKRNNIFAFNRQKIDRERCVRCHHLQTLRLLQTETLKKVHRYKTAHWRSYLGRDSRTVSDGPVSVHVTTQYYKDNTSTSAITVFSLRDTLECNHCHKIKTLDYKTERYGHV